MSQAQRDEASIHRPDEPYRYDERIEWDEDVYGWVSVEHPHTYTAWWDWENEEWKPIR